MLSDLVALGPDRPALTIGDTTRSFGELDARANRVAHALRRAGLVPGDRVGILSRNRTEYVEALFGAARAGVVLVGLNWRLAPPEIAAVLDNAGPSLVLAGSAERALVPDGVEVLDLDTGYETWIADEPDTLPDVLVAPGDVVLQLYSSGTTGVPKGARLTHANLAFTPRMGREFYRMGPDSVNLVPSPQFHIGGIGYGLTTLGQGGHTVLVAAVDPAEMLRLIERHRVTHSFLVPAVVQMLLSAPEIEGTDLSSLELIAYGGAPMTEPLLRRAMDRFGCGFLGVYGMTETAGTLVSLAPGDHDPGGPRAGLLRSVGKALPWHDVAVFDPLTDEPSPPGQVGEIRVRSAQNMAGYWRRDDETASTLSGDGWLRTGDAAYTDDEGYLFLHDRIKDMIISGGENVYPAEVENALASHPGVSEVAVIGVPSPRWGETVKALVVAHPGSGATAEELIAHSRGHLARYKCPTSVDFVDELPRNASGKVLKKVLREPYWPDAAPVGDPASGRLTGMTSGIGKRRKSAQDEGTTAYQERRTEIVTAAAQLFKDHGYAGTSLADVAESLSMDRASLYYYVGGKQELFQDVVGGAVERNALRAEEIVAGTGTAPEKLRRLVVELMVSYAESYPFLYVYIQEHLGAVSPDRSAWAQRMRGYNKRYENAVVAVVQAGVDDATFAVGTQPWVIAYGVIGMVAWSNRWYRPGDASVPAREIGEAYADTLLGGLQVRST